MKPTYMLMGVMILIAQFACGSAMAQFPSNSTSTFYICNATGAQTQVSAFADGTGGSFAVWTDKRDGTGGSALYGQHLDSLGNPGWGGNGHLLYHVGAGLDVWKSRGVRWGRGILVAWIQGPNGNNADSLLCDYYDMTGTPIWSHPSVVASKAPGLLFVGMDNLDIYPNDSGATISYSMLPLGSNNYFSFNRVDTSGNLRWPVNTFTYSGNGYYYVSCADNYGGLYVAAATGGIGSHLFVQHFDMQGNKRCQADGVDISTLAGGRNNDMWNMVCDADTNVYIVWDNNNPGDMVACKLTPDGNFAWSGQYRNICDAPGAQAYSSVIMHRNNLYVTWADGRPGAVGAFIYLQKIDTAGNAKWTPNGVQICNLAAYIPYPKVAPSGENVVTTYKVNDGFRAQLTQPDSTPLWGRNGIVVNSTDPPFYGDYALVTSADGSVAAIWSTNDNVVGARVRPYGPVSAVAMSPSGSVAITPNPVTGRMTITLPEHQGEARVTVTNMGGMEVASRRAEPGITTMGIDLGGLSGGVYVVRVAYGEHVETGKIVVQ
jgi:hypothetical protein